MVYPAFLAQCSIVFPSWCILCNTFYFKKCVCVWGGRGGVRRRALKAPSIQIRRTKAAMVVVFSRYTMIGQHLQRTHVIGGFVCQ